MNISKIAIPNGISSNVVAFICYPVIFVIFILDVMTGDEISLHSLYVIPVILLTLHVDRKLLVNGSIFLSWILQTITFLSNDISLESVLLDSLIGCVTLLLTYFITKTARTYYINQAIISDNLELERAKLEATIDSSEVGFVLCNAKGGDITMNATALRLHEYASMEELGRTIEENENKWELRYLDGRIIPFDEWPLVRAIHGNFVRDFEFNYHNLKTDTYWTCGLTVSPVRNSAGEVTLIVQTLIDITKAKQHEAELSHVAHFDGLTGIPNRILLADRMQQAIAQTSRDQNMMAICYLDLDGFKPINDDLGHESGDNVLVEIARRIEQTIRGGDTVARLGGDEFVVLLLGLEQGGECVATLERLLGAIAQPIGVKDKFTAVSASIGVSIYPQDDEDPDTLLRHADQAMYVAKQNGKNRFHIYDPQMDRRARDQNEFVKSIRHALEQNQFELFYQPKVNLLTKKMVGAEALIRWRHPERGIIPPAEFLRTIENTDLDIAIGDWVIVTALTQIKLWQDAGLLIEVSINISGYHLESKNFIEKLSHKLGKHPEISEGMLQIEVLETVALNDVNVVQGIIESCRKIGVGFALDDFGTGYSSLSYLSNLPVDTLKIDQSFVRDMLEDKGGMAIVQGIIALAKAFNRQTVAEGVETDEHYQALLDMGCEIGQGYCIARPMTAEKLLDWNVNFRLGRN